jgi:hypothetical protein
MDVVLYRLLRKIQRRCNLFISKTRAIMGISRVAKVAIARKLAVRLLRESRRRIIPLKWLSDPELAGTSYSLYCIAFLTMPS